MLGVVPVDIPLKDLVIVVFIGRLDRIEIQDFGRGLEDDFTIIRVRVTTTCPVAVDSRATISPDWAQDYPTSF